MILTILGVIVVAFLAIPVLMVMGMAAFFICHEIWVTFWSPLFHGRLPWDSQ